jgi:hypothetical protein
MVDRRNVLLSFPALQEGISSIVVVVEELLSGT